MEYITDIQRKLAGFSPPVDDSQSFAVGTDLEGADIRTLNTVGDIEEVVGDCCDELDLCSAELGSCREENADLIESLEELCSSQPPLGSWTESALTGCDNLPRRAIYDISATVRTAGPEPGSPNTITLKYSSSKVWKYNITKSTGDILWGETAPACIGGDSIDMRVVISGGNCSSTRINIIGVFSTVKRDVLACYASGKVVKVGTIETVGTGDVIFVDDRFAACEQEE